MTDQLTQTGASIPQQNTPSQRKIIHCDCDCFFVAVEVRDDPLLLGRPVAVGGSSDRRGVISTCSYEARAHGIHSAMASATAKRLCPDLIILPSQFEKYREASRQIKEIFYDYTDLVQPLSLDEAFLDVTHSDMFQGSATLIAEDIRRRVRETVGITISAGVAPNKFLAKVASDWNKPDGIKVVSPAEVDAFVEKLPVKKIFGVGKVTEKKLASFGVTTCGDLRQYSVYDLSERFGRFGRRLHELSWGIDERKVENNHRRKSLSVERTFSNDLKDSQACLDELPKLFLMLKSRLRKVDNNYLIHKHFVKVKFHDFTVTTLERVGKELSLEHYQNLCEEAFQRGNKAVRLLGMGVRFIDLEGREDPAQLSLFDDLD